MVGWNNEILRLRSPGTLAHDYSPAGKIYNPSREKRDKALNSFHCFSALFCFWVKRTEEGR